MMKNFLFICMLLLGLSTSALAQESIVVTGVVTDTNKEPMIGVNVSISNIPRSEERSVGKECRSR